MKSILISLMLLLAVSCSENEDKSIQNSTTTTALDTHEPINTDTEFSNAKVKTSGLVEVVPSGPPYMADEYTGQVLCSLKSKDLVLDSIQYEIIPETTLMRYFPGKLSSDQGTRKLTTLICANKKESVIGEIISGRTKDNLDDTISFSELSWKINGRQMPLISDPYRHLSHLQYSEFCRSKGLVYADSEQEIGGLNIKSYNKESFSTWRDQEGALLNNFNDDLKVFKLAYNVSLKVGLGEIAQISDLPRAGFSAGIDRITCGKPGWAHKKLSFESKNEVDGNVVFENLYYETKARGKSYVNTQNLKAIQTEYLQSGKPFASSFLQDFIFARRSDSQGRLLDAPTDAFCRALTGNANATIVNYEEKYYTIDPYTPNIRPIFVSADDISIVSMRNTVTRDRDGYITYKYLKSVSCKLL